MLNRGEEGTSEGGGERSGRSLQDDHGGARMHHHHHASGGSSHQQNDPRFFPTTSTNSTATHSTSRGETGPRPTIPADLLKEMRLSGSSDSAPPHPPPIRSGGVVVHRCAAAKGKPNLPTGEETVITHHHPPREAIKDVGVPINGGSTLLIAYFPYEASESDVERVFNEFCAVKKVHLVMDKHKLKPRCFGFVKLADVGEAMKVLEAAKNGFVQLQDGRVHIWHLKAEWAKTGDMIDEADKGKGGKKGRGKKGKSEGRKEGRDGGESGFQNVPAKGMAGHYNAQYDAGAPGSHQHGWKYEQEALAYEHAAYGASMIPGSTLPPGYGVGAHTKGGQGHNNGVYGGGAPSAAGFQNSGMIPPPHGRGSNGGGYATTTGGKGGASASIAGGTPGVPHSGAPPRWDPYHDPSSVYPPSVLETGPSPMDYYPYDPAVAHGNYYRRNSRGGENF